VVVIHMVALHTTKSNNPLGIDPKGPQDTIPFHPYYTVKDYFGLGVFLIVFAAFVFFAPNFFGEPDNYIRANPMNTPPEIVPEWYFLPYYAILRSIDFNVFFIPAKLLGVTLMFGSILVLFVLPWLDTSKVRSARFRPIYKQFFWLLIVDSVVLGMVGAHPPNELVFEGIESVQWILVGKVATAYYFLHFLVLVPLIGKLERPRPLPNSISEPILAGTGAAKTKESA